MATVMNPNLQSPWVSPTDAPTIYPTNITPPVAGPSHSPYTVQSFPPTPDLSPEVLLAQGRALPPHLGGYGLHRHPGHPMVMTPGVPYGYHHGRADFARPYAPLFHGPQYDEPQANDRVFAADIKSRQRTSQQNRDILEYWFRRYDKPFGDLRQGLLKECGMDARTLQVWFQNRRSKEKALRRKARKKAKTEWMDKYHLQPPPHEDDSDYECADESDDEPSTGSEEVETDFVELMPHGKKGKRKVPKKKIRRREDTRFATLLPVGAGENPGTSEILRNFPVPHGFPFRERSYEIPPPEILRRQGYVLQEVGSTAPKGRRASLANGEAARIGQGHTPQYQALSARRGSVPYALPPVSPGMWNPAYETPAMRPPMRTPLVKMATQNNRRASTPAVLHNQYPFTPVRNVSRRNLPPIKDHDPDEHTLSTTLNPTASTYAPGFTSLTASPAGYTPGPLPNPHFAFGSVPGGSYDGDAPPWGYRDRVGSIASEWTVNTETPTDAPTDDSSFELEVPYGFQSDMRRASAPAGMVDGIHQLSVMTGVRPVRPSPLSANSFGHPGEFYDHERTPSLPMDPAEVSRLQMSLQSYSSIGSSPVVSMAPPMSTTMSHESGLPASMQSAIHSALQSQSASTVQSAVQSVDVSPIQHTLPSYSTQVSPENVTQMPPYGATFNLNTGHFSTVFGDHRVEPPAQQYVHSAFEAYDSGQFFSNGLARSATGDSNSAQDHSDPVPDGATEDNLALLIANPEKFLDGHLIN